MFHTNQAVADPADIHKSIEDIFYDILGTTIYGHYISKSNRLFELAEASIETPSLIHEINSILNTLSSKDTRDFIHLLHLTLFIKTLKKTIETPITFQGIPTPVTDSITQLLSCTDIKTALTLIPMHLIDVLTSHPVDMDRGLIVNHKRQLEALTKTWHIKKTLYPLINEHHLKLSARAELGNLSQDIRDALCQLIHTPNYRKTKIKPESEQRNLSRAIKANEEAIISHWPKLILFVQFTFFEALLTELIEKTPSLRPVLTPLYGLARTQANLAILKNSSHLQHHDCFSDIIKLSTTLRYSLQIWRGDMDGNPFVTGETIALSTAYGRKRCFERLSADDAVIRYIPESDSFKTIEKEIELRLSKLKQTGERAWKQYIQNRESEEWAPTQIYSGLMYYRMVEMTEAAEEYSRKSHPISLLQVGFKHENDFLTSTDVLEKVEEAVGIRNGTWSKCRRRVSLRGLSLGLPHARKGESFHFDIILEALHLLDISQDVTKDTFNTKTKQEKKSLLHRLLNIHHNEISNVLSQLSHTSLDLLNHYRTLINIQPDATLVQSDSGSITHDIEISILILKCISLMIGHTGKMAVLCEDKESMLSAISLMNQNNHPDRLFDRIIMMCAGSDNQKKAGPFYSTYINTLFLKTAHTKNITAFFGVGDSPLRSSTLDPQCSLKTFQPGSRKKFFFGDHIYDYLSQRLATQINHISFNKQLQTDLEEIYITIIKSLGETMYDAYQASIKTRTTLHHHIQSISEIVTTYFSRPSKKYNDSGFILDKIRAIDSGRAQLILNTFDPQLSGLTEGLNNFIKRMKQEDIHQKTYHTFFNTTPTGQSFLNTLTYFVNHLDDDINTPQDIQNIRIINIKNCYQELSGKTLSSQVDPYLRLSRLVWNYVQRSSNAENNRAVAMMMFGANWMI